MSSQFTTIRIRKITRDLINEDKRGLEEQDDVINRWHDSAIKLAEMRVEA